MKVLKVSVIMANFRGAEHLSDALSSVLRQSHGDLELIVSDDASPDNSVSTVKAAMATDSRLRLIEAPSNAGPAAARNRALDAATGDWIALVDSDDLMHPQRIERLLAGAQRLGADIIADDMVFFGDTAAASGRTLLQPMALTAPLTVDAALFLKASGEDPHLPALGYLKPLIRHNRIGSMRYDESLRIGEDYDFTLRLLLADLRYAVLPDPMYLYRRHSGSISHRLTEPAVRAILSAHDLMANSAPAKLHSALTLRRKGLLALLDYERLLQTIRNRKVLMAAGLLLRQPSLILSLGHSLADRLSRKTSVPETRRQARVRLGQAVPSQLIEPLSVSCSAVPPAGDEWLLSPAPMAATLSALAARYVLSCDPLDDAGAWAADLVPSSPAV